MIRRNRFATLVAALIACVAPLTASAQALPDSLVARVRAGALRVELPADSVVIPMVGTRTLPLIEATINGRGPYRLLIDLGSNVTLLRRNVVDQSGSTVVVERSTTDIVHVDSIGLGGARLGDVTVGAYDELDVDGVIGYNVLQYTSFTLDFPAQRLVLHRRALPEPDERTVFSYQIHGRMPYIVGRLGADSVLLNLDTGAGDQMTVPTAVAPKLRWVSPPVPGRSLMNNQTGRVQVTEGRLVDTLRFGPLRIPSPLVYVNPEVDDAWLGMRAMGDAAWTFDPAQRRVRVTLAERQPPAARP